MLRILLRRVVLVALALCATGAFAAERHYTAVAPDGVTLAITETGNPDGPPVVLIHGLDGSRLTWDAQARSPRLAKYRLIAYDLRGHGRSGHPVGTEPYSDGRRWADDLAVVIEAAHADRPVLVGWSLGGAVISNYLSAYGDGKIAGAVYVNGVIEFAPEQIRPHPAVYRDLKSLDLGTHLDALRTFVGLCFATRPPAATVERLQAAAAMASWDMQEGVQSMTIDTAGLARAQVPMLLVYGERDALIAARPTVARAQALNPRARATFYAKSGHAPFVEESARFDRDLGAFVDAVR